ncbi:MAG TPA: hypothetical protein VII36_10605, partial [Usitatibacter sp.]
MNGEALAALELPAITGRLGAASATELGAERASALLPATEVAEVIARQALTAEAVALLDAAQDPPLAGIADVRDAAARAEREGMLGPPELRAIATAIRVGLAARRIIEEQRVLAPLLHERLVAIDPALAPVADEIDRCIEEDGSDVRDTASPVLRRLRRELASGAARVREELARVARSSDVQEALQE